MDARTATLLTAAITSPGLAASGQAGHEKSRSTETTTRSKPAIYSRIQTTSCLDCLAQVKTIVAGKQKSHFHVPQHTHPLSFTQLDCTAARENV